MFIIGSGKWNGLINSCFEATTGRVASQPPSYLGCSTISHPINFYANLTLSTLERGENGR